MSFNSFAYFAFLSAIVVACRLAPVTWRNLLLLLASWSFYACFDPRFLGLLLLTTATDFLCADRIHASAGRRRHAFLVLSLAVNLGVLCTFKYLGFFADSLAKVFHLESCSDVFRLALPVGISFYTFQSIGYTVDVWRGSIKPVRGFLDYALYVGFFPQLAAGPIERAGRMLPRILLPRHAGPEDLRTGLWLILLGLFKKVVVAGQMARVAGPAFDHPAATGGADMLLAFYAYAFQVYADFSGYSDIARGSARLLGFDLVLNFRVPFLAPNIQEFWNRWHISLSEWVRNFVFFPLMRNGWTAGRTRLNLLLTMILIGLWHGAGLKYILFGLYHGVLLVAFESTRGLRRRLRPAGEGLAATAYKAFSILLTFHLVVTAFTVFGCKWTERLWQMWAAVLTRFDLAAVDRLHLLLMAWFLAPLVALLLYKERVGQDPLPHLPRPLRLLVVIYLVLAVAIHGVVDSGRFIYFQF